MLNEGTDHRRLAAIMFTDMVGSTQLKQELGDQGALALIQRHHAKIRELLAQFQAGKEISTAGDSFFLVFANPSDAVKFALVLQARFRALAQETGRLIIDRIGIHVGEVFVEAGEDASTPKDLHGMQVDTCARVMGLAQGNQILMTRSVFDNARQVLKGQDLDGVGLLAWLNHGPYLLKGVEEPLEVCEVGEAGKGALTAPSNSEKARRHVTDESEPVLGWRPAIEQVVPNTQWVLERKLGEGGFGEVWLGRHQKLKERRVFKFCFRADRVRSLKREMTLFRVLKERVGDHPNIVALRDVYLEEPPFYVVMDHVEGQDLQTWCRERGGAERVPLETRLEIVAQIADALQAAHDAGVIHRDVKPGNILVSSPKSEVANPKLTAKLTDFGIGQVVSEEALRGVTKAGFTQTIISDSSSSQTGSQMYMAPELLAGKPASTRSDIYSLGVVLYQLLVGDLACPLTTDWAKNILDPLLRDDLEHCFAGNPSNRFPGAGQLANNLRALPQRHAELDRQKAEQMRGEQALRAALRRRRVVVLASGVAMGLVLLIAALGYGLKRARQAEQETNRQLYVSDMIVAEKALSEGHIRDVEEILDAHLPKGGGREDPRGFEYYYLRQQCVGKQAFAFPPQECALFAAAYSPDGKVLATGSSYLEEKDFSGALKLFDVESRKEIYTFVLSGPDGIPTSDGIRSLAFSPEGQLLASGTAGSVVTIWNAVTHQKLDSFFARAGPVMGMAFSTDGRLLASLVSGAPGALVVWDTVARKQTNLFKLPPGDVSAMAFSPDGKTLGFAVGNSLRLWDLDSQRVVTETVLPFDRDIYCLDFSSDSKALGCGGSSGFVALWDLERRQLTKLGKHQREVISAAFSRHGRQLATSSADGTIKLWDPAGRTEVLLPGHRDSVRQVRFSPDGSYLASASQDKTLRLWAVAPAEVDVLRGHERGVLKVEFSPDGKLMATVSGEQTVNIWDPNSGEPRKTLTDTSNAIDHVAFSADGKYLAAGGFERKVKLWEAGTWQAVTNLTFPDHGAGVSGLCFSRNGRFLVVGERGFIGVWEVGSWRSLTNLVAATGGGMALSRDGRLLAVGSPYAPTARLFEVGGWGLFTTLSALHEGMSALTFTPDSRTFITGGGDSTIKIWDVASGRTRAPVKGLAGSVRALACSPDGKTLASSDMSGAIKLVNLATSKELLTLLGHDGPVTSLAFSPDSTTLVSGSLDTTVRLWRSAVRQAPNASAQKKL